ncbi:helix-turn-helix domain-containing protein [Antribacter gilvus]|uniref:helix-turn-helix domain-containing protein n=1 Tax=Antribacter gilvus TaxID=2304675 RepID=UPI000F78C7C7|nr:helix-turn-helix domain-containing protein [Antribacter gilvus]
MTEENLDKLLANVDPVLTPDEVATLLRMEKAAVYRWLNSKYLPGSKLGGQWRILRDDVRDLLRGGSNQRSDHDVSDTSGTPEPGGPN